MEKTQAEIINEIALKYLNTWSSIEAILTNDGEEYESDDDIIDGAIVQMEELAEMSSAALYELRRAKAELDAEKQYQPSLLNAARSALKTLEWCKQCNDEEGIIVPEVNSIIERLGKEINKVDYGNHNEE